MRYVDFKSVIKESILNEGLGYTKGDLAETVWSAGVAAGFMMYPDTPSEEDVISMIENLKPEKSNEFNFYKTRKDGLKSELADTIIFKNIINMKKHQEDLPKIRTSIEKIRGEVDQGLLKNAFSQAKGIELDLKDIFANGKADSIVVGAEGGADQKDTKVDVAVTHIDTNGNKEVRRITYSLKTDTGSSGIMPVSQGPGVDKGSGGQVAMFQGLGIIKDIEEASIDDYNKLDQELRQYLNNAIQQGGLQTTNGVAKLDKKYEDEMSQMRIKNSGRTTFINNIRKAASTINAEINTDKEEGRFLDSLIVFLKVHVNKNEPGIRLLTFDKKGAYTTTIEKFEENKDNFGIKAIVNDTNASPYLDVIAVDQDGTIDKKNLIVRVRFKQSDGRFSGSSYIKAVQAGKVNPTGYQLLRYTITVETGKGYRKFAEVE